jgi:hypothetical protein
MIRTTAAVVVATAMPLLAPVLSGQIVLQNGDRLSGAILHADAKAVTIRTAAAGDVSVAWTVIRELASTVPLYVVTVDHGTLVGAVSTDSTDLVVTTTQGPVRVPLASTPVIRSEAEERAFERAQHPGLLNNLQGGASGAFTIARGNSQTTNLSFGFNTVRTTPWDRTTIDAASLYASDPTGTTANDVRGDVRYERNVAATAFGFVSADYEHNKPQLLDLRQVYTLGLGFHAVKRDSTALDLLGGANYTREVYVPAPTNNAAGATLGENVIWWFGSSVGFTEEAFAYPDLTHSGQYRATLDARLTTQVKRWLSWQSGVSDRYVSNPPPGTKQNDFTFTTGLNITFSH